VIYLLFSSFFRDANSDTNLILRVAGAALRSFLVVVLAGPSVIRWLVRKKVGDRPEFDRADLNELMRHKSNTPTMGGLLISGAILGSVLMFADLTNKYITMGLFALVWLGGLGAVDDWFKLRRAAGKTSRDGLKSWQKILFQVGLAVLLSIFMYSYGGALHEVVSSGAGRTPLAQIDNPAHNFYLPFRPAPLAVGLLAYVLVMVFTMVGSSNAVNLTDGMDGLASGCVIIVSAFFLVISWVVGARAFGQELFNLPFVPGAAEMTVLCAAMVGACLGFLWHNAHPASVFMGDTGSLPLGGLIGYIAVVTRGELLLVIAGGVFVMEAVSVLLQVGYFKATKPPGSTQGKRLFRCAPLHHHFHLSGWPETKVVVRFWVLGLVFAALALATLKLR
jgi:phospho-N-acetylmuramoyl-pentapeptide-transferase